MPGAAEAGRRGRASAEGQPRPGGGRKADPSVRETAAARPRRPAPAAPSRLHSAPRPRPAAPSSAPGSGPGAPPAPYLSPRRGAAAPQVPAAAFRPAPRSLRVRDGAGAGLRAEPPPPPPSPAVSAAATALPPQPPRPPPAESSPERTMGPAGGRAAAEQADRCARCSALPRPRAQEGAAAALRAEESEGGKRRPGRAWAGAREGGAERAAAHADPRPGARASDRPASPLASGRPPCSSGRAPRRRGRTPAAALAVPLQTVCRLQPPNPCTSSFCFETGSLRVDQAGLLPGYHKQSWFVGSVLAPHRTDLRTPLGTRGRKRSFLTTSELNREANKRAFL